MTEQPNTSTSSNNIAPGSTPLPTFTPDTLTPASVEERVTKVKQERSQEAQDSVNRFFGQEPEPTNQPLFVVENLQNQPYISVVLNVGDAWQSDIQESRLKIATIDYHLKKEIEARGWKPTTQAYRDVYKEAYKELQLSKNMSNLDMLNRLYYYFHLKKLAYG